MFNKVLPYVLPKQTTPSTVAHKLSQVAGNTAFISNAAFSKNSAASTLIHQLPKPPESRSLRAPRIGSTTQLRTFASASEGQSQNPENRGTSEETNASVANQPPQFVQDHQALPQRAFADLSKKELTQMEKNSPNALLSLSDYGVKYDISQTLKQQLYDADLAPYHASDVAKQLADANVAAAAQQVAEPDKHDPFDTKSTIDLIPCHKTSDLFNFHTQSQETPAQALAAAQGRRSTMEDAHTCASFTLALPNSVGTLAQIPVRFSALFDGHGGDSCAYFSASNIEEMLKTQLTAFNENGLTEAGIANAITHSIVGLSHAYNSDNLPAASYQPIAGSTLNLVMEIGDTAYFANVGDSRAFFVGGTGRVQQLTADHTLRDSEQRAQITQRGGYVVSQRGMHRVNGRLAVPAALGAHWTNGAVSARPRIGALPLEALKDGVIVQACDGLFEVASTTQLGERVHESLMDGLTLQETATDALMAAYHCGSQDNLSIIISKVSAD